MAIDHTNCGLESRQFCDDLLDALLDVAPSTVRNESTTCSFRVGDSNRFAYLYHKADTSLATIFFRGDDPSIVPALSNGAVSELRKNLTGNWAKEFPQSIHLPGDSSAIETARLLVDFSLPLAAKKRGTRIGREILNGEHISDGKRKTILVTVHERNRTLRAKCLQHHGYSCAGCGLLMKDLYGKIAIDFIHVHHINPVANTGETYPDPRTDLVPLCPNCHSVVHLKSPPMSISSLRLVIAGNRG